MDIQTLKKCFKEYRDAGYRPFPVVCYSHTSIPKGGTVPVTKAEKDPVVGWKRYQTVAPTDAEIDRWCAHPLAPYYGIGISTEGLIILDFDQKDGKPDMLQFADHVSIGDTMWTQTRSGGVHLYYKNLNHTRLTVNIFHKDKELGETTVDIRADGGYAVLGPTEFWSRDPRVKSVDPLTVLSRYTTDNLTNTTELPEPPLSFIAHVAPENKIPKYKEIVEDGPVKPGGRHDTAVSMSFGLLLPVKDKQAYIVAEQTYWRMLEEKFPNLYDEGARANYQAAWDSAYMKIKADKPPGWPDEATAIIREMKAKVKTELDFNADMDGWDVKIVRVISIGELFKFVLEDGKKFQMEASDILSQTKFRTAYYAGIRKVLPTIKNKSFEKFLESLPTENEEASGASLHEMIKDILGDQYEALYSSAGQTVEAALEQISVSTWAVFGRTILFKVSSLIQVSQALARRSNSSKIISALDDIGALRKKVGSTKYWEYVIAP